MVLVVLAILLVGMAVVILSQMSSDLLFDAKQAQRRAIQRNETVSQREWAQHLSNQPLKR